MDAWVDSHCHVHSADDADAQIERAQDAGVAWMVSVGTDLPTSQQAMSLAARHLNVRATVGLHPHDASKLGAEWDMLEALARTDECAGIGEAGFDLFYERSPRDEQEVAFRFQIHLAKRLGKALVILSRDAWDDTFRVLADEGVPDRTVFHCFTGGPAEARRALDLGCWLSFSGIVSFKNAADLRAAANIVPADRLLVETDAPYLAPEPYRGKPNEPAYVTAVGAALAAARSVDATDIAGITRGERGRGLRSVNPTELRALLEKHGVRASKALGQHFLVDPNTARRIIRFASIEPGDRVVEVGPGVGALTVALADAGARVLAVELDRHLLPVLEEVVDARDVDVVAGDAMTVDWSTLLTPDERWGMVSNLPYNVATPVVVRALEEAPMIDRMLVMVQREVGERLAASVGTKQYGAVTVKVAYYARAAVVGVVPPTVFAPRPNVESALVTLVRHEPPVAVGDPARLFELVRAGFATRRKTLRNALRTVFGARTEEVLRAAGIDPMRRAETLTLEDWAQVAAVPT